MRGSRVLPRLLRASALVLWALGCAAPRPTTEPPPAPPRGPERAEAVAPPECADILSLHVAKSRRRLEVRCARGAVVVMTVALGRSALGHKQEAGDHRTPEGTYRVAGPLQESRFHGFIPLDYPSRSDADAALRDGRISPQDHARILDAHDRGMLPPGDTPLGGGIGFHGEGDRWRDHSRFLDWTYGCLALRDEDLDFIAARISEGVVVHIEP